MTTGERTPRHLERRWAARYSFRAELEIEWGSAVLRGKTRDISANGMFIESTDTLWVGAGFTARLALERPVQIDCSVKRVEPGQGMAVTVIASGEQHKQRYQDLITSLTRALP
jgi:PilZ domain